jgi:hypothetical protein
MEEADRKPNPDKIEALLSTAFQYTFHIQTTIGYTEQVIHGIAKDKTGLTGFIFKPPIFPRAGLQKSLY